MANLHSEPLDSRIGVLSSGQFYAFANGYDRPETVGTRHEVEQALGIAIVKAPEPVSEHQNALKRFNVVMRFEYPAWDEVDGISYDAIQAISKSDANRQARRLAERDGHAIGGRGRYFFTATEV